VDSTLIIRELLDNVPVETHGVRSERPAAARRA